MPPHGEINCNVFSWRTKCLLVDTGFLLVELLVESLCTTTVSSCITSLFDWFPTLGSGFLLFSHGGLIVTFLSSSGLRNVLAIFWIAPIGPIYIGGADVTVVLCC